MLRRLRRALGFFFKLSLAAALAVAAIVVSIAYHVQLPIAREVATQWITILASDAMKGAISIGSIEKISREGVAAHNITLFDGYGRPVVRARDLTLVIDFQALRHGRLRIARAVLDGAVVILVEEEDGLPTLISSFDAPTPSLEPDTGAPLEVAIDGIELRGVRLIGDLLGLEGIRATPLTAKGQIHIGKDVHIRIDEATTTLVEPFGFDAELSEIHGTISTVATEGIDLYAHARRGDEHAQVHVRYRRPGEAVDTPHELDLDVEADSVRPDTLRAIGLTWLPPIRVPLSGSLELGGPLDDLALWAELESEAGPTTLQGTISKQRGFAVSVKSDGLRVDTAFEQAPPLELAGSVRIEAKPDEAEPRVHAELEPLMYGTVAIPALTFEGRLTANGVDVERLSSHQRGARLTAHGEVLDDGSLELRVRASYGDISQEPNLRRLAPDAHGRLQADVRITTPQLGQGRINFSGRIVIDDVRYGLLRARRVVLTGSARGDPERPALDLRLTGEDVSFAAYALGTAQVTLTGGPRDYRANGQFTTRGTRTFNLDATIAARDGGFTVDADPIEVAVGEGSWRGALKSLRIVPGRGVQLELLRLASLSQRLEAKGEIQFHGEDHIEAQLQDFDLAALHAIVGDAMPISQGRTDSSVLLSGDIADPVLEIQGALRGGRAFGVDDVNALYLVNYRHGQLELDGEVDLGERGLLRAGGTGKLDPGIPDPAQALLEGSYDLELSGDKLDLSLFGTTVREAGWTGRLGGSIRFKGTLHDPDMAGIVTLDPLEIEGWDPLSVTADSTYAGGMWRGRVTLEDERGRLMQVNGEMKLDWGRLMSDSGVFVQTVFDGPWHLEGSVIDRRLDQLPRPLVDRVPFPITLDAAFDVEREDRKSSGSVRFGAVWNRSLTGTQCAAKVRPEMRGTLQLSGGESDVSIELLASGRRVGSVAARIATPVDQWVDQGYAELPESFGAGLKLDVAQMNEFPYLCEQGEGELHADLELDRRPGQAPVLVGSVDGRLLPHPYRGGERLLQAESICKGDPARLHADLSGGQTTLVVTGELGGCHGGAARFDGKVPIDWGPLTMWPLPDGDKPLSGSFALTGAQLKPLLDRLIDFADAEGLAYGRLAFNGTWSQPRATGEIDVRSGRLTLVSTGQQFDELTLRLSFRGDWAKLEELRAKSGKGVLRASGGIGFDGFLPRRSNLALVVEDMPVEREGIDLAWLTGSGALDADIDDRRLRAVLKLHQLDAKLPDRENRALQSLEPHPDVTVVTATPELREEPYPVELVIDGQRPMRVHRNDFDAMIQTELAVRYADPDVNVGGYLEFRSGTFEVFGKRFDISRGTLRFDGGTELNPDVNLVAVHQPVLAGSSSVTAVVTGTLAEPEVTFTSDACPGESGAITYLISGKCLADDPGIAQESAGAQNAFAAGVVGGILTLGAQRELGGLLPRLAVESTGEGAQTRVKAGVLTESIVPRFMRPLIQRVYIQGAISTAPTDQPTASGTQPDESASASLDFLIELYFPHNIVGAGKFGQESWGVDVTWEP